MKLASSFFVFAFIVFCLGFTTAQKVEAAEDRTPPEITGFNLSPSQVNTADEDQVITVTISLEDDLSGTCGNPYEVDNCIPITLYLAPQIGTQELMFYNGFVLTEGDNLDGTYVGEATLPKWSKVGVWEVDLLVFGDALGNSVQLNADDLATLFPDSNLTVVNTASEESVTIEKEWTLSPTNGLITAIFSEDTVVTRKDSGSFQFYKMVNQPYSVNNLPVADDLNGTPVGAIRFGVPGLNLSFNKPVRMSMRVSAQYADQTLIIRGLEEGKNKWVNEGTCVVVYHGDQVAQEEYDAFTDEVAPVLDENGQPVSIPDPDDTDSYGTCDFTVSHASYFTANVTPYVVTGTKSGARPAVRVFSTNGTLVSSFLAYAPTMTSGINVAVGDINGDGTNEIITSARTGGGPQIRVFDVNGTNLDWDFYAYDENFRGGVNIAVGDIEGDGPAEIVTAPMANGGPNVRVFGLRGDEIVATTENFMAYDENFRGGIAVSIGDIEGDGIGDIITTPISRGGPHVRVFGVRNSRYVPVTLGVMAYAESFRGGINSCIGDVDGDGWDEIMTGIVSAGGPHVRILGVPALNSAVGLESPGFYAYAEDHRGGIEMTTLDVDGDGVEEIVTGVGGDGSPVVRFFNAAGEQALDEFEAYDSNFKNGITLTSGLF